MTLGIGIPYYKNSEECEIAFKKLMKTLEKQVGGNVWLMIYEDGQISDWLKSYNANTTVIGHSTINKGVAKTRNILLFALKNFDYIMYLDSDDMIDCDFISKMYELASSYTFDMIVSPMIMNKRELFQPTRSNVAGICLRTKFIEGITFNEEYNISEDSQFIEEVYKRNPKIGKINSNYYYNYGINPNSLMIRFERNEIGLKKEQ